MKKAMLEVAIPILSLNIGDIVHVTWDKGIGSYLLIKNKWEFISLGTIDIYDSLYFTILDDESEG